MRRYGIRSAILTILKFWREDLQSKEAVNQYYHRARNVTGERIISEDLELFYTSLNPERQLNEDYANIFAAQKLTEEELTLLENRNKDFLNTFRWYEADDHTFFDGLIKEMKKSNDPESIFIWSSGYRWTKVLHVTLK